jgi:membrane fusion protein (multidrug efflux system)
MNLSLLRTAVASTIVLALMMLSGCDKVAPQKADIPKPNVVIETIKESLVKPEMSFIGRTEATEDVSIRAQVEGRLLKRDFNGGDDVQKGDLLFQIDPTPYQTVVTQKKASLSHSKSAFEIATSRWNRGDKLSSTGAISEMDMDELTADKNQKESDVALNKAALETAELNLSYTKIVAPIAGRISRSQVSIGDLITPNSTELATLVQLDPIWVNFQIAEEKMLDARQEFAAGNLKINEKSIIVTIEFNEQTNYNYPGEIDFIDNRIDQSTGTLAIRAIFPNPENILLPGQYTSLVLGLPDEKKLLLVSQVAVQEEQQGRFVLVVNDENIVEKRMVTLSTRYNARWQIEKGLKIGERVIVDGLQKVQMGSVVETTENTEQPF